MYETIMKALRYAIHHIVTEMCAQIAIHAHITYSTQSKMK